jgi:hypothetical protein
MSKEQASVASGRAHTPVLGGPSPARRRGSRAAARPAATDTAQSDGARTGAGPAGTTALLSLAAVVLVAVALLLRAGAIHVSAVGPWAGDSSGSRGTPAPATRTIDPRLILVPRTVTQAATAAGVRMELTAGPLLPGPNRFELRLAARGRPLAGARVLLVARMIGMAMRPVALPMSAAQPGRYAATGPLTMFGPWQVTLQIDRSGTAHIRHQFTLSVDLPRGLLTAPATRGAPRQ